MQQIQQQISLYQNLFYVCLGVCIFCFVLSIIFFFKFDIRNIFNARTGRSVRKTVQQVEEMNARTGQLRRPSGRGNTGTLSRSGNLGNSRRLSMVRKAKMEDIVVPPSQETAALAGAMMPGGGDTEVLSTEERKTVTAEMVQDQVDESFGMFKIKKYVMIIHTDEVV